MTSPLNRWRARRACHGTWWLCCQYVDRPMCNSPRDPHLLGRIVWRVDVWRVAG